jgi:cytochrome P450
MSTICTLEPKINHITQAVWSKFRDLADIGRPIDLQEWTTYYASDVVCQLGLGAPLGFVEKGGDVNGILHSIHTYFYAAANLGYLPGRTKWVDNSLMRGILRLFAPGKDTGSNGLTNFIISQVTHRLQSSPDEKRPSDMLDHFLSMKDPSGEKVGMPDVAVEGGNLLGAGGDTTAVGIAVVLKYLLSHPEDYKRLQQEVDKAYADHHFDDKAGEHLSYDIASKLPFLNACIKEGTRLVPSILWQLPRECPKEGITIAGHFIPPKATLSMSPIAQNRCKEIFGEDANEWRPERFTVGDGGMPAEYVRNIEKHLVTVSMPQTATLPGSSKARTNSFSVRLRLSNLRRSQSRTGGTARLCRRVCPSLRLRAGQQGHAMCAPLVLVLSSGETDDQATHAQCVTMTLRVSSLALSYAKYAGLYKEKRWSSNENKIS